MVLIGDVEKNENAKLYIIPVTGISYYPQKVYAKGAKVITYSGERHVPTAKSKDLLLNFLALREARKHGAIEALLVDKEGTIREGTKSNFYAIKGNSILIPPKEKVLEGTVKQILLKICKDHFEIKEEDIQLSKIKDYDEFFITSTLLNVMPISQINETKIETNFEKTKTIQKLFKEYYHKEVLEK